MRVLPVEVPEFDDGLQLVQEPHHTVQGQLWGLQRRVNIKYISSKLNSSLIWLMLLWREWGVNYVIKSNSTVMSTQKMDCIIHYPNYS